AVAVVVDTIAGFRCWATSGRTADERFRAGVADAASCALTCPGADGTALAEPSDVVDGPVAVVVDTVAGFCRGTTGRHTADERFRACIADSTAGALTCPGSDTACLSEPSDVVDGSVAVVVNSV